MDRFVHVMPLDDVIDHEGSPGCVCGPGGQSVTAADIGEPASPPDDDAMPGWSRPAVGMIYHHYALSPCREWEAVPEP
ncbi:hypothetical protein [Microbispora triticiradicis]|uniref:Uncharacterized protein n=2 Tax=Microbispora TaxID=2005 RepID=A0ABY3LRW1_9ACTN|nr:MULTISPECIES: hypothetical protein [Microbispora]TLP54584.1 hypothetical protein FED44_27945 [Microbispora fusca]TYB51551.1 hypothetical protein FXF59_26335 [Microbispora tritici]